ncbi:MAG TPA: ABC transporter permease [Longimicrobiales bacterium]|nr:ABC transporter permease [Longimicrobiales bacterium]
MGPVGRGLLALIGRLVPPTDRAFLLGDLEEEWARRWAADRLAALRWLASEAVGIVRVHGRPPTLVPRWRRESALALRRIRRRPAVPLLVSLTLGLGIGAVTGVLAVVDGVLMRPLDLPRGDRLVAVCSRHPTTEGFCVASPGDAVALRGLAALEDVGLARGWAFSLRTSDGVEGVTGGLATPGAFRVLGLRPALGRLYDDVDQARGEAAAVAVLSHDAWTRRFGADPGVVGRVLRLDDRPVEVVGVLARAAGVPGLETVEVWTPLPFPEDDPEQAGWRGFRGFGVLASGASRGGLAEEAEALATALSATDPVTWGGWRFDTPDLREHLIGPVKSTLRAFLAAAALVLLVAALNAAGLLLTRAASAAEARRVQVALGADRRDLLLGTLIETGLLGLAGASLGVLLTAVLLPVLLAGAPPIPRLDEVTLDGRVFLGALLVTGAASALAAIVPALGQGGGRAPLLSRAPGEGRRAGRFRTILVTFQVAAAVALLGTAGLLGRSILHLTRFDPGVPADRTVAAWLLTTGDSVDTGLAAARGHEAAAERIRALPGVRAAGLVSASRFFGGRETERVGVADRPGDEPVVRWHDVGPGALEALGHRIVAGRPVSPDDRNGTERVAWVDETFARRHLPPDPVGARLRLLDREGVEVRVAGVVSDPPRADPSAPVEPQVWLPLEQWPRYAAFLVYQTEADPGPVSVVLEDRVHEVSGEIQVGSPRTVASSLERERAPFRFSAAVVVVFGTLSLALAALGLYGSLSYAVACRRREIGIRRTLGERRGGTLRATVRDGMLPGLAGTALGLVGVGLGGRATAGLRVGVGAWDPVTLLVTAAAVLTVVALASWVPALRASRVDPAVVLREG